MSVCYMLTYCEIIVKMKRKKWFLPYLNEVSSQSKRTVGMQSRTVYVMILCLRWYPNTPIFLPEFLGLFVVSFFLILFRSKEVIPRFRTRNKVSIITTERNVSSHTFRDQLSCPICKELFLQPLMLPCKHCICEKCINKSKTRAEVTENFYIILCPVCSKAHCLDYANKIQLRKNYLRAKLAKKYMRRHGFLRWRFDHSERPVYCETCKERRRVATKRCRTCGISNCSECLYLSHNKCSLQDHILTRVL